MDTTDDQHANLLAFQAFLDSSRDARETVVELTAFRRLCGRGIPNHPRHLRPLAYSLLLQTLPAQKTSWKGVLKHRRKEYHALVEKYMQELEAMPAPSAPLNPTDKLLKSISAEVERAIPRFPYLKTRTSTSESSPLSPPATDEEDTPEDNAEASGSSSSGESDTHDDQVVRRTKRPVKKLLCRRATMKRLEMIAEAEHRRQSDLRQTSRPPSRQTSTGDPTESSSSSISPPVLSPRITLSSEPNGPILSRLESKRPVPLKTPQLSLSPPDLQTASANSTSSTPLSPITLLSPKPIPPPGSLPFSSLSGQLLQPDTHAEVLVRLLYVFTRTNPSVSIQGLVDILAVLYSVYLEVDIVQMPKKRKTPPAVVTSTGVWVEEQVYFAFIALTQRFKSLIFDEPVSKEVAKMEGQVKEEDLVSSLARFSNQLKWADQQLWTILDQRNLLPSPLYAYRWLATLYTQDFSPQVILYLWDFILAESFPEPNTNPSDPLIDIGVAILVRCKRLLMGYTPVPASQSRRGLWGDFEEKELPEERDISQDLEILRSPPLSQIGGISAILDTAFELRTARLVDQMESMGKEVAGPTKWASTMGRVAESDRAASLSKASSNITASMISTWSSATRAVSHARLPSGGISSSISASSLFSRKTEEEDRGETYTSLPTTPRRNGKAAFSPPMEHSPLAGLRLSRYTPDRGAVPPPKRSESITSVGSMSSLQERLAALTHTVAPATPARSGPRPLMLSSSASTRRVSVPATLSRQKSPTPSRSPSPTKQRQSMPLDIGRGFPSTFEDSPPNGAQSTLSPPLQIEPAGLYRTTSNSSVGLYRVMSGEEDEPRGARRLSDTQERERGEEGGLYKINGRPRSPVPPVLPRSRAASPAMSEGRGGENGMGVKPRGPRPGGPRGTTMKSVPMLEEQSESINTAHDV